MVIKSIVNNFMLKLMILRLNKFLENHNLPNVTQWETEHLISSIVYNLTQSVFSQILTKITIGSYNITGKLHQVFKEKNKTNFMQNILQI